MSVEDSALMQMLQRLVLTWLGWKVQIVPHFVSSSQEVLSQQIALLYLVFEEQHTQDFYALLCCSLEASILR